MLSGGNSWKFRITKVVHTFTAEALAIVNEIEIV
jgi:hypothetical protein